MVYAFLSTLSITWVAAGSMLGRFVHCTMSCAIGRTNCGVAEAAIAEAMSTRSRMESSMASLAAQAEASTVQVISALSKHMEKMAADTEACTSCMVGSVAHRLEQEIEATAISIAMTSKQNARSAVDILRDEI